MLVSMSHDKKEEGLKRMGTKTSFMVLYFPSLSYNRMIGLLKFCFSSDPNIQTKVIGESEKSCTCVAEKKNIRRTGG